MDAEQVSELVELQDYIGQYCDLEERNGEFWCLSPFTNEKTPSFSINPSENLYYDFSSGQGGGLIKFIMMYHRLDYDSALLEAAKFAGIDPNDPKYRKFDSTKALRRLSKAEKQLPEPLNAFLAPDVMERYAFDLEKLKPWLEEGISEESLRKFQVRYDAHSNSILYPVLDEDGKILVISARTLDPDWQRKRIRKYTYLSKWGTNSVLYGLFENKQAILNKKEIVIFEGAKSVMKCDSWGIGNTVAALTSRLNEHQLRLLIGLGCDVVIGFDKGVDPKADPNVRKLRHFTRVSAIVDTKNLLQEKMAPVDAGADVFHELYKTKINLN